MENQVILHILYWTDLVITVSDAGYLWPKKIKMAMEGEDGKEEQGCAFSVSL